MKLAFSTLLILFSIVLNAQIISIPDPNFKDALLNASVNENIAQDLDGNNTAIDLNENGEIELVEALNISRLSVSYMEINDLTGVEAFENLQSLSGLGNNLSFINVSTLNELKTLHLSSNDLTTIDVTELSQLNYLFISGNRLKAIDLSNNLQLTSIILSRNELTSIDLSGLTSLQFLYLNENSFSNIDLTDLSNVETLFLSENPLSELDLSGNTELKSFFCMDCNLESLDLSFSDKLQGLHINDNPNLRSLNMKNFNFRADALLFYMENCPNIEYICADGKAIRGVEGIVNSYGYDNCFVNSICNYEPDQPYYRIEGKLTFDDDLNGCDLNDQYHPDYISIFSGDNQGDILADENGYYYMNLQAGDYDLMPTFSNNDYYIVTPAIATVQLPDQGEVVNQDFCVSANGQKVDLKIRNTTLNEEVFYNEQNAFELAYQNQGNVLLEGSVKFIYDGEVASYASAVPAPTSIVSGEVIWDFEELQAFEQRVIRIVLEYNGPFDDPPLNEGDIVSYTASVNSPLNDETPGDNTIVFEYSVTMNTLSVPSIVKNDILAYPNPVRDVLYIQSDKISLAKNLRIYDFSGKQIYIKKHPEGDSQINFSNMASGMYFLIIETEEGITHKKIIKS